ncbi:hypothetical protein Tco_0443006 [Tanacetum coccineum]
MASLDVPSEANDEDADIVLDYSSDDVVLKLNIDLNSLLHEVVMEKDSKIYRGKKERVKSIALKAKKESSNDETSTSESDDEEYAMAILRSPKNRSEAKETKKRSPGVVILGVRS